MIKKIHICDKCGKETITSRPEKANYRTIKIGISQIDDEFASFEGGYSNHITLPQLYLCPDCLSQLGINSKETANYNILNEKDKTVEDRILELLTLLNVKFEG